MRDASNAAPHGALTGIFGQQIHLPPQFVLIHARSSRGCAAATPTPIRPYPEAEAGNAAGCHPKGVAGTTTTMEARLAGVAAAVEGDVVAVGVGVGVAAAHPLDERA